MASLCRGRVCGWWRFLYVIGDMWNVTRHMWNVTGDMCTMESFISVGELFITSYSIAILQLYASAVTDILHIKNRQIKSWRDTIGFCCFLQAIIFRVESIRPAPTNPTVYSSKACDSWASLSIQVFSIELNGVYEWNNCVRITSCHRDLF